MHIVNICIRRLVKQKIKSDGFCQGESKTTLKISFAKFTDNRVNIYVFIMNDDDVPSATRTQIYTAGCRFYHEAFTKEINRSCISTLFLYCNWFQHYT